MMRMTHLEQFAKKPEQYVQMLRVGRQQESSRQTEKTMQTEHGAGIWALFDYAKRDPLTNDAAVQYISALTD